MESSSKTLTLLSKFNNTFPADINNHHHHQHTSDSLLQSLTENKEEATTTSASSSMSTVSSTYCRNSSERLMNYRHRTSSTSSISSLADTLVSERFESADEQGGNERDGDDLVPCDNFGYVVEGLFRSAMPKKINYSFLKSLGLKTVITLIMEEYPEANKKFLEENGIKLYQFGLPGHKEQLGDNIPDEPIVAALSIILDRRNHPVLIHCKKGKHRTGCLVGCLRKFQQWSEASILEEYRSFSHPKSRPNDQKFIKEFDTKNVVFNEEFLPDWPEICVRNRNKSLI